MYSATNFHRDMPHLAEKLNVQYSQKEKEFQRANAKKEQCLRTNQNNPSAKIANALREASPHDEIGDNDPTNSLDKSSTANAAAEYMLESMRKEHIEEISDQVFKQHHVSEMIAWMQIQIHGRKNYSSNLSCVGHANLNNSQTLAPYVIPSCPRPEFYSDPLLGYALLAEPHESPAKDFEATSWLRVSY